jgi:hypothetical protein
VTLGEDHRKPVILVGNKVRNNILMSSLFYSGVVDLDPWDPYLIIWPPDPDSDPSCLLKIERNF